MMTIKWRKYRDHCRATGDVEDSPFQPPRRYKGFFLLGTHRKGIGDARTWTLHWRTRLKTCKDAGVDSHQVKFVLPRFSYTPPPIHTHTSLSDTHSAWAPELRTDQANLPHCPFMAHPLPSVGWIKTGQDKTRLDCPHLGLQIA